VDSVARHYREVRELGQMRSEPVASQLASSGQSSPGKEDADVGPYMVDQGRHGLGRGAREFAWAAGSLQLPPPIEETEPTRTRVDGIGLPKR